MLESRLSLQAILFQINQKVKDSFSYRTVICLVYNIYGEAVYIDSALYLGKYYKLSESMYKMDEFHTQILLALIVLVILLIAGYFFFGFAG